MSDRLPECGGWGCEGEGGNGVDRGVGVIGGCNGGNRGGGGGRRRGVGG